MKKYPVIVRLGMLACLLTLFFISDPSTPLTVRSVEAASQRKKSTKKRTTTKSRKRVSRGGGSISPAFDKVMSENRALLGATTEPEQPAAKIDDHVLRAHIKYLSDDMLEGRGTGSRGGMLAARYIATQLESMGLEPASPDGSYFQYVQMIGSRTDPASRLTIKGGGDLDLSFGADFVGGSDLEQTEIPIDGDLLFVGYGINSPENKWDDYKGLDVRGKILVMLVNDPPSTPAEPDLFGGRALTYYGRWTYKFEEAARRGAAGAILIHTNESAGYGWSVVRNSWNGEHFGLMPDGRTPVLKLKSWVTEDAARRIAQLGGQNLDQLRQIASTRAFRPVPLSSRLAMTLRTQVQRMTSPNVVAIYRGSDQALRNQFVVYSSHWDHLGLRPDQSGDNIYNGAVDNATGIAGLIAIARSYAALSVRPKRSVLFVATTAEEQGLLGAEYYLRNPLVPLKDTVANINLDSLNVLGTTTDISPLGANRSTLGKLIEDLAKENNLTVSQESNPEQGSFYRSDHFPFAKAGIPAISLQAGHKFVGHPDNWADEQRADFTQHRYHQPGDEYSPNWDFSGMVQQVRIAYLIGLRVANSADVPRYNAGDEFAR